MIHSFLLFALLFIIGCSQSKKIVSNNQTDVLQTIRQLEEKAFTAEFKLDTATIASLMHERFISVGLKNISNKQQELAGIHKNISQMKKDEHIIDSFYLDDFKVQHYNNTAIATFFSVTKGSIKGKAFTDRRWRWYDVWVKENDQWKFVSSQGTPLDKQ